ncbi:hypothetical protein CPC08DRAFT_690862 [Agrocybe pediades]|nr:hypothetical protein CPC08DRAFT_690862 [Agrocybe pediades]
MSLLTQSVPNYEEAATVAADFISSLDNLPQEVQHLLQEIKIKDQRCYELQQDIAKDQAKYIKSALKQSAPPSTSIVQGNSRTASPVTTPTSTHSKAHLPARISNAYAELEALSNEKTEIAQRILNLLTRTRSRLDSDLTRVRTLQGEPTEDVRNPYIPNIPSVAQLRSASPYGLKRAESGLSGTNAVIQLGESLRNATHADNVISISAASGPSYTKKRKINANTSIKLPSPAPVAVQSHSTASHSRSRLSRQSTARAQQQQQQEEEDLDADAEGEEDIEEDAEEDLTLYCFCHKQSYGDMIGCDNPDCPYQWFHISCVGVKTPLPDKWYCPECIKAKQEKRKGRKKQ